MGPTGLFEAGVWKFVLGAVETAIALRSPVRDAMGELIECRKPKLFELRRIRWSTFANLDHWFGNWKEGLVELGFAKDTKDFDEYQHEVSEVSLLPGQKRRRINFDKSVTSTDGADCNKGAPRSKSPESSTFIGGTTEASENIPCHMQFQSDAQNVDDAAVSCSWIDGLPI
eukprot:9010150-Ditylum_brightwellii.AAC.1